MQKFDHNIGFCKKWQFFRRKLAKNDALAKAAGYSGIVSAYAYMWVVRSTPARVLRKMKKIVFHVH
jgi:hypothetical protein